MTGRKTTCMISGLLSGAILGIGTPAHPAGYSILGNEPAITRATPEPAAGPPPATGPPEMLIRRTSKPAVPLIQSRSALPPDRLLPLSDRAIEQIDASSQTTSIISAQRALRKFGYDPGPIDGLMGPRTRSAIKAFKEGNGLAASGTANPQPYDGPIANHLPEPYPLSVSVRSAVRGAVRTRTRPLPTIQAWSNSDDSTKPRLSLSANKSAVTEAKHLSTEKAEPQSRIQLAFADSFYLLRAMSQFAMRLVMEPSPRATEAAKMESGTGNSPEGPAMGFPSVAWQFAVRFFTGPGPRDTETTGVKAGIGNAPDGSAGIILSEAE